MMFGKTIKYFNKNIILLFLILIFAVYFSFFSNVYKVFARSFDERILRVYGYDCNKSAYGFILNVKNNYLKNSKAHIVNFESQELMKSLFYSLGKDEEKKMLILINYNKQNLREYSININDYQLLHKSKGCFLYKKKI